MGGVAFLLLKICFKIKIICQELVDSNLEEAMDSSQFPDLKPGQAGQKTKYLVTK
jgi:hypothetical protein